LIFSGDLGHYGGQADLALLSKARILKRMKPQLEIGWDGGINNSNAAQLISGGVEVLNAGSFLEKAAVIGEAYASLEKTVQGTVGVDNDH